MFLLLCEYASITPTGNELNVVRGALDRFTSRELPLQAESYLVIMVNAGQLAEGDQKVTCRLVHDASGKEALRGEGLVEIKRADRPLVVVLPAKFVAVSEGAHTFVVEIGELRGTLTITIAVEGGPT